MFSVRHRRLLVVPHPLRRRSRRSARGLQFPDRLASLTWRVLIRVAPLAFVAGCEATVPFHPPTSAPEPTDDVSRLEDSLSPSSRARFESRRIDVAIVETSPSRRGYVFRDARGPVTENDFVERYREATSAHDLDGDRPHPTEDLLGGAYLTGLGLGGFVSASTLDDVRDTSNIGAIALGSVAVAVTVAGLLWGGGALATWNGTATEHRLTRLEAELYAARYNRAVLRSEMNADSDVATGAKTMR
jgi:hypothetical protein